jgi:hypothetical protein
VEEIPRDSLGSGYTPTLWGRRFMQHGFWS